MKIKWLDDWYLDNKVYSRSIGTEDSAWTGYVAVAIRRGFLVPTLKVTIFIETDPEEADIRETRLAEYWELSDDETLTLVENWALTRADTMAAGYAPFPIGK